MSRHPVPDDEWSSTDTQRLTKKVDQSSAEWRRSVIEQIEPMAKTLEEVRDLGRETALALRLKASQQEVAVLTNDVHWLRYITLSVLVIGILDKLAKHFS